MNEYQIRKCLSTIKTKCFDSQEPKNYEFNNIDKIQSYFEYRQKAEEFSKLSKLKDYGFISQDIINLCKQHKAYYKDIFYGSECPYKVELTCRCCGEKFIRELGKGKIYSLIENKVGEEDADILFCESCSKSNVKEDLECQLEGLKIAEIKRDKKHEKIRYKNTEYYITNYLNPNNSWKESCAQKERFNAISISLVDREAIGKYIRNMEYSDFLNTPYWKAISQQAKYNVKFKCQLCGNTKNLNTHHKTYEHHGEELQYMKTDLIVLCKNCHEKFHNIVD